MANTVTRMRLEQRINVLYAFALSQGYSVTALGPGRQGRHHYLVQNGGRAYLEISISSQGGTFLLSTEQGMSGHERMTPTFIVWLEGEGFRYRLDEPYSRQVCKYLDGKHTDPIHAPTVAPSRASREETKSEDEVCIQQLLPNQPNWFAVYAIDPEVDTIGGYEERPIVGWALVNGASLQAGSIRPNAITSVVGLFVWDAVEEGFLPEAYPHIVNHDDELFLGYRFPGSTIDWKDRAAYQQKILLQRRMHTSS